MAVEGGKMMRCFTEISTGCFVPTSRPTSRRGYSGGFTDSVRHMFGWESGMFGMFFRIINAHHSRKRDVENKHPAQHPVQKRLRISGFGRLGMLGMFSGPPRMRRFEESSYIAGGTFYFPNIPTSRLGHRVLNQNHATWTRTAGPQVEWRSAA